MISGIFVNLPILNLKRSVDFFTGLGFTFNAQFTSEDSTCMIIGDNMFVMLLEHEKFSSFIDKPIAESGSTEALIALSVESKVKAQEIAEKAFELGARRYSEPIDHGFMFSWGFEDLDGHIWELFWMDPTHVQ